MLKNEKHLPYFYKITNNINGKYYYGSGQYDEYAGSGFALKRAYKKYGKENFTYIILRYFNTRNEAYRFEQLFLSIYKLDMDKKSYNCIRNAHGGYISNKFYKKLSRIIKNYRKTEQGSIAGLKNPRANKNIYIFYNIDSNEYRKSTIYDMNVLTGAKACVFGYLVRGNKKMYKGWILAENIEKWGTREKLRIEHRINWKHSRKQTLDLKAA